MYISGLRTFSNVNVLHKGLLLQDWLFRLGVGQIFSVCFCTPLYQECTYNKKTLEVSSAGRETPDMWEHKITFGHLRS